MNAESIVLWAMSMPAQNTNWWEQMNVPAFSEWMLLLALASPALLIVAVLGAWAFVHRREGDIQIASETGLPR